MRRDLNVDNYIASLYKIRQYREEIDLLFPLQKSFYGVYNNYKKKLSSVVIPLIMKQNNDADNNAKTKFDWNVNKLIKIKICGDSTNIGKNFNFL